MGDIENFSMEKYFFKGIHLQITGKELKKMVGYKYLKQEELGHLCRECLNRKHGLKLKRQDCVYGYYSGQCVRCGKMKHIVIDISLKSRWKLLFGKK